MASRRVDRLRLPAGTVTFLFTDIEGSTQLLQELGDGFAEALAVHHAIVREAITAHNGVEVRTQGDAFFVVFERASDALAAATRAQRRLLATRTKVRMGLHTGEASVAGDDYIGLAVHEAARIASATHGGQILVSEATRALAGGDGFADLGEHRLKDIPGPVRLWQVTGEGLPTEFPTPRTTIRKGNLPRPPTSFIGRAADLEALARMIHDSRMVTLTGIGGVGKTRLAIQLARAVADDFPGGTWFIDLAPITDPALLTQAALAAFGLRENTGREPVAVLGDFLAGRTALAIIDNCEHLLDESARLASAIMDASEDVRIVSTAREPVGVPGESVWRVPSMTDDAVQLFVERARAAGATVDPGQAVADICRRLDGIPLAIELAAAKAAVLDVDEIAARLDDRFRLLTGGARIAVERHQTLRAAVEWSYDLLSESERVLLQRLSVFVSGFTLEAAEAICGDPPVTDVLDGITALVTKSLAAVEGGSPRRYRLLETIRQFARERLTAEDGERIRDAHLRFFADFVEPIDWQGRSDKPVAWRPEYDNIMAALDWAEAAGRAHDLIRICQHMWFVWLIRGFWAEGRRRMERAVALIEEATHTQAIGDLHLGLGQIAYFQEDYATCIAEFARALPAFRASGDVGAEVFVMLGPVKAGNDSLEGMEARTLEALEVARRSGNRRIEVYPTEHLFGIALSRGDFDAAVGHCEESLAICAETGTLEAAYYAYHELASALLGRGDFEGARANTEIVLAKAQKSGDPRMTVVNLLQLATIEGRSGRPERAQELAEEAVRVAEEAGWRSGQIVALSGLAVQVVGDPERALAIADDAVRLAQDYHSSEALAQALGARGEVRARLGTQAEAVADLQAAGRHILQHRRPEPRSVLETIRAIGRTHYGAGLDDEAATTWGVADGLGQAWGARPAHDPEIDEAVDGARARLGDERFEAARGRGSTMSVAEGLAYALRCDEQGNPS